MIIDNHNEIGGFKRTPYGKRKRTKKQYAVVDNLDVFSVIHEPAKTNPPIQPEEVGGSVGEFVNNLANLGFTESQIELFKTLPEYKVFKNELLRNLPQEALDYFTTMLTVKLDADSEEEIVVTENNDVVDDYKGESEMDKENVNPIEGADTNETPEQNTAQESEKTQPKIEIPFWCSPSGIAIKDTTKNIVIFGSVVGVGWYLYKRFTSK